MLLIVRGGHVTVNRIGAVGGKSDLMCVWLMEGWTENISGGWGGADEGGTVLVWFGK